MEIIIKMVCVCLLVINTAAFILYGIDKHKALKGKWRVPEATLISIAAWIPLKRKWFL